MKVIIPLAGFGKRLRPHTYTKPKPLVNVAGKAVLGHILDKLQGLDVEEIVFIVGWLGEQIEEYVSANYEFRAHYVEQKELLGQAHAIRLAREWVDGQVLVIFVDTIFEADLARLATLPSDGEHTENSIVIPPVYIDLSAKVVNSIVGPHVHIGPNSVVVDSLVGPYVSLAEGSQVHISIIKDTIINEESHIEEAMLSWSLVGRDALVRGTFERLNVGDSSEIDSSRRLTQE